MEYTPMDFFWAYLIIIDNILIYIRRIILTRYGHQFVLIDLMFKDNKRFKAVINKMEKGNKRNWYKILNVVIPSLFIIALLLAILSIIIKK